VVLLIYVRANAAVVATDRTPTELADGAGKAPAVFTVQEERSVGE